MEAPVVLQTLEDIDFIHAKSNYIGNCDWKINVHFKDGSVFLDAARIDCLDFEIIAGRGTADCNGPLPEDVRIRLRKLAVSGLIEMGVIAPSEASKEFLVNVSA